VAHDVVGLVEHLAGQRELALRRVAVGLVDQREGGSLGPGGVAARARDGETALGELEASAEVLAVDVEPAQRSPASAEAVVRILSAR